MTLEELYDNYTFKVIKRALMREFPFIKNVYVKDPATIDRYKSFIFIDVDINPYELSHQYGLKVDKIADRHLRRGEPYYGPYISLFIGGDIEDSRPIRNAISELVDGVQNSTAIPEEFKLGKDIEIGGYYANHNTVPPDIMS